MNSNAHVWRRTFRTSLHALAGLLLGLAPAAAQAPATEQERPPAAAAEPAQAQPAPADASPPQFFDSVTVTATMNPATVRDTPGTVSVIDARTIARRMIENTADLVKYEPGVYVESNPTRVGLNGFNIRGIGGNRVMTQVDGVDTSEQFDFGPFNVHQFSLDLDTLKSAEIVRSAGSALYGSDALGGVVSFFTKDPSDYMAGRPLHLGFKTTYDGRAGDAGGNLVVAGGRRRMQASLFAGYTNGHEPINQGTVRSENATRTALNPQDRDALQALAKVTVAVADGNLLRLALETNDQEIFTNAYSLRTAAAPDISSNDRMERRRVSVDQSGTGGLGLHQWSWSAFAQTSDTAQVVNERRAAAGPSPLLDRAGTLDYSQKSYGGSLQGRRAAAAGAGSMLFTFGGTVKRHTFDMLRDRLDIAVATGAVVPAVGLILPTKYFPKSDVSETGGYLQTEIRLGRLLLVPGARFDRFSLDADSSDAVFLASLSPAPADFSASAVSTKLGTTFRVSNAVTLHAQFAEGFRAPPYSAVNSGFTNLLGGYTSLPNTNLDAERSDNFEAGVRTTLGGVSFGVTAFRNDYDDFILQALRGLNPATGLLEYQYQNLSRVKIHGVELQGEARLHDSLRLRASYAAIRGNDVSGAVDVPLNTIAPDQGVVGLLYAPDSSRWGSEVTLRAVRGQSQAVAGSGFFAPGAYGVLDATGWLALGRSLTLRGGVMNATDTRYFEWANVRGRSSAETTLDRYSSPGVSGLVSLSYGW